SQSVPCCGQRTTGECLRWWISNAARRSLNENVRRAPQTRRTKNAQQIRSFEQMFFSNSNFSATARSGIDEHARSLKVWTGEHDQDDDPSFVDRFTLGADQVEDPETGCLVEISGDDYYGDAATLARVYWHEGMAPDDIRATIDRAGTEL